MRLSRESLLRRPEGITDNQRSRKQELKFLAAVRARISLRDSSRDVILEGNSRQLPGIKVKRCRNLVPREAQAYLSKK